MAERLEDFVRPLLEDPDDEASALIFADWLEERGDPRGEWLRLSRQLSRWIPDLHMRRPLLERQARVRQVWAETLNNLLGPDISWTFHDGLTYLTTTASRAHNSFRGQWSGRLLASWAAELRLEELVGALDLLEGAVYLEEVRGLDLSGQNLGDAGLLKLLQCPHLGQLRRLNLAGNDLTDLGARILADTLLLQRLTHLDLRNNRLTPAGIRTLLQARPVALRSLLTHGNPRGPEGLAVLAAWRQEQETLPRPGPFPRLVNSLGMEFVLIPAGSFLMGSPESEPLRNRNEGPCREVVLTRPFYLGVYPVTHEEWTAVVRRDPSAFLAEEREPNWPIDSITWDLAQEFCQRLSDLPAERAAGRVYRLPTEAEWEHACRAGTLSVFWWGASLSSRQANFDGNYPYGDAEPGPSLGRPSPVGAYPLVHPFGLFDLCGNVWEWCSDWYGPRVAGRGPTYDPTGPAQGTRKVLKGGGWYFYGQVCRPAFRGAMTPGVEHAFIGLRLALDVATR